MLLSESPVMKHLRVIYEMHTELIRAPFNGNSLILMFFLRILFALVQLVSQPLPFLCCFAALFLT